MTYPVNSLEAIAAAWDSRVDEYAESLLRSDGRAVAAGVELELSVKSLPRRSGLTLLDAGCGPGFHGRDLLARWHRVTFVDASKSMLDRARQGLPQSSVQATFVQGDIRNIPTFADASFHGIIAGGTVISDCGDAESGLGELSRILKPCGVIGFSVRNMLGPQLCDNRVQVISGGGPGFDWWFFSPDSLSLLCDRTSLSLKSIHPVHIQGVGGANIQECILAHLASDLSSKVLSKAWEFFAVAEKRG